MYLVLHVLKLIERLKLKLPIKSAKLPFKLENVKSSMSHAPGIVNQGLRSIRPIHCPHF